jgi:histidinol-phosphatase (PHP family)
LAACFRENCLGAQEAALNTPKEWNIGGNSSRTRSLGVLAVANTLEASRFLHFPFIFRTYNRFQSQREREKELNRMRETMMSQPLLYETHAHTPLCKHAVGDPMEYADVAYRRGFHGLLVTCHNPMPADFSPHVRMAVDEFDEYLRLVFRARQQWRGLIDVRLGIEADYFPGYEAWLERQLRLADFQYVLGSVHPQVPEFRERYWRGDALEFQRTYFRLLADAAETGLFDCLSHPDIVKNSDPDQWVPARIMDDICLALDRIARTGVAMELNTSGVNKEIPEMNPFPGMLVEMRKRSIPVVIGADAHQPERVGDGFHAALDLLEASGYQDVSFYINRFRRDVPIAVARNGLRKRRSAMPTAPFLYETQPVQGTLMARN